MLGAKPVRAPSCAGGRVALGGQGQAFRAPEGVHPAGKGIQVLTASLGKSICMQLELDLFAFVAQLLDGTAEVFGTELYLGTPVTVSGQKVAVSRGHPVLLGHCSSQRSTVVLLRLAQLKTSTGDCSSL